MSEQGLTTPQSRSTGLFVLLSGLALMLVALAFRGWYAFQGWFAFDDVVFLTRVNGQSLTTDLLFDGYGGHLMPGGFLLTWLYGHGGALDYTPYAATLVALQAIAFLGALLLLRSLFGGRWGILVPYSIYLTSAVSFPGFIWWAAGVNQLALQIALTWGLLAHVAYLRTRRLRWVLATVVVMVGCLFFYEKVLLVYGAVAIVTVAYFCSGTWRDRVSQVWSNYRLGLLAHVVCGAGYLVAYALLALNFGGSSSGGYSFAELAGNLVGRTAVPGVVGGPLEWAVLSGPFQIVDPSALVTLLAWLAMIGVVVHLSQRRIRSLRAWTIPLWFLACDLLLLGQARAIALGGIIGLEMRYVTELSLAASLALGLAAMPLRGAVESAAPRDARPLLGGRELVAAATVVVCALGTLSTWRYADHWVSDDRTRNYFDNADATLGTPDQPTPLANVSVPQYIMWGYDYPANTTEHVLRSFSDRMTFPDATVNNLYVINDDGQVTPAGVTPLVTSDPPSGRCGYRAHGSTVARVPMAEPARGTDWWVRTAMRTTESQKVQISASPTSEVVELTPGLHNVYLHVRNNFDTVEVKASEGSAPVCVFESAAGFAVPLGAGDGSQDKQD